MSVPAFPSRSETPGARLPLHLAGPRPDPFAGLPATQVEPPSTTRAMGQAVYDVVGGGIDVTFGTHWAIEEYRMASKRLRAIGQEDVAVADWVARIPQMQDVSVPTRREWLKNAHAQLLMNRYDRYGTQIRRVVHGGGVGAGGLLLGTGMALGPNIFGSFSAGVAAVSTPIAFAGAPILSAVACGIGAYEFYTVHRLGKLAPSLDKLARNPLLEHELETRALMATRLSAMRWHAGVKGAAMIGLAVAAPLLVVGAGPGVGVGAPAAVAGLGAAYYRQTRLVYEAQLTAEERVALGGKHDIANRIHLEQQEYRTLKTLKQQKRLLYPLGTNGLPVLRDVLKGLGAARRWFHGPLDYDPSHETVMTFLREQASHDVEYLRDQKVVVAHEASKAQAEGDPADRARRTAELESEVLDKALARSQQYQLSVGMQGDPTPEVETVLRHFLAFVAQHQLEQRLLVAAQGDSIRKLFKKHDLFARDADHVWVDLPRMVEMLRPDGPEALPEADREAFVAQLSDFSERFLLTSEKQRATYARNELTDFLMIREWGNTLLDDPATVPLAPTVA